MMLATYTCDRCKATATVKGRNIQAHLPPLWEGITLPLSDSYAPARYISVHTCPTCSGALAKLRREPPTENDEPIQEQLRQFILQLLEDEGYKPTP